ncbi:MAG: BACON domain-containing carbohydrate-binding protein [Acidobacteria bacterium]|nr:BACON domain-containing carbohydrate-binding protein [Acidobacteriota bacterium]
MRILIFILCALAGTSIDAQCTYSVTQSAYSVPAGGTSVVAPLSLSVTTQAGCTTAATSQADWISIVNAAGTGSRNISFSVTGNPGVAPRVGQWTVGDKTIAVTQAADCSFTLTPASASLPAARTPSSFLINANANRCAWTAVPQDSWLTVSLGGSGTGDGTSGYTAEQNLTPAARTSSILVVNRSHTVNQAAGNCNYTYGLGIPGIVPADGGTYKLPISTSCVWQVRSTVDWISFASPTTGTGTGSVDVVIAKNAGFGQRSSRIENWNSPFTVTQAGQPCALTLNPSPVNFSAAGGTSSIGVTAPCPWTATTTTPWITIGTPTANSFPVNVIANPTTDRRSGLVRVNDVNLVVTQDGATCGFKLTPLSATLPSSAASETVQVETTCAWSATSSVPWMRVTEATPTLLRYAVDQNGLTTSRTGTLNLTGRVGASNVPGPAFTVRQAGQAPLFTLADLRNGASFITGSISPGEIMTIFGTGYGPAQLAVPEITPATTFYPTSLAGVRVLVDNIAAPVTATIGGDRPQVNFVVPHSVAGKRQVEVRLEYNGVLSDPVSVGVTAANPEIFALTPEGQGAVFNEDYTVNSVSQPAKQGSVVAMFATGGGVTSPPSVDGFIVQGEPLPRTIAKVQVLANSQQCEVSYAGAAPLLISGALQVNAKLPPGLPAGALELTLIVGEVRSQRRITIQVE